MRKRRSDPTHRHSARRSYRRLLGIAVLTVVQCAPASASRGPTSLPSEPPLLSERQVGRALQDRLPQMRQWHETQRSARQAQRLDALRRRLREDPDLPLRREPIDLPVQPLPATSD